MVHIPESCKNTFLKMIHNKSLVEKCRVSVHQTRNRAKFTEIHRVDAFECTKKNPSQASATDKSEYSPRSNHLSKNNDSILM